MKKLTISTAILAALLSACGGGGGDDSSTSKPTVTAVKFVGASLADSGTFGYKFTVQSPGSPPPIYSESVVAAYGLAANCPAYTYQTTSSSFTGNLGCRNYAVAGAKVNNYDVTYETVLETIPTSLIKQLVDVGTAGFGANDLLVVGEASANDAAALASGYIAQTFQSGTDFTVLLSTLVSAQDLATYASDPTTLGTLYMQALADKLVAAVKANALDKGATRIALLNTLDVTMTPKFQAALGSIAAASSETVAGNVQLMVQAWIRAFNDRLAANISPYSANMAVVDFYGNFNAELANPTQYGLTNITSSVCDEVVTGGQAPGVTSLSVPATVSTCTVAAASSFVPAHGSDGTYNWWQSYLFADNFHPTPYGHSLLSDIVTNRLKAVGWL